MDQYNPVGTLSYEAVQDRIRDELVKAKATEFAESVGQAFAVRVTCAVKECRAVCVDGLKLHHSSAILKDLLAKTELKLGE